jgi:hypothetical protein
MALSFGDAIKAGQNFDFGAYKEPAGFNVDFFSPDQTSSINWSDIYANPDVLKGLGDSYKDPFEKGIDFLKNFTSDDEKSQFLNTQKSAAGLPTDKSGSWYQQATPSVGFYGNSPTGGFLGGPLPAIAAGQGAFAGMNPGMQSLGFNDYAKMAAQGLGSALTSKALYAINPVLGAVNQFYPGGAPAAFKDVTKFAGDAFGGIAKGVGGIVKGIGNFFCDERLKVDIAPLESTEVNDELAQMAFFVKGLRECS